MKCLLRSIQTAIHWDGFNVPNIGGILGDRPIAGELTGAAHVNNGLAHPSVVVLIQRANRGLRLSVDRQIGQVQIIIAVCQERGTQRVEDSWFAWAEVVQEDQIERFAGFRLIMVVPIRIVPAAAIGDLLGA
jgi:hypothetical protein